VIPVWRLRRSNDLNDRRVREVRPAKTLSDLILQQRTLKTILFQRCQQTTLTYDRAKNLAMLVQKINALTRVIIFSSLPDLFHRLASHLTGDIFVGESLLRGKSRSRNRTDETTPTSPTSAPSMLADELDKPANDASQIELVDDTR